MLNVLIPMAGRGSRFIDAGYREPKPLIPIHGRPMIEVVTENLRPAQPHRFIFVCQQSHIDDYGLGERLQQIAPGCVIIPITEITEGAACTVLLARKYIDNGDPLVIANCDQYVDIDINDFYAACVGYDGVIMTMWGDHVKWSFIAYDNAGNISGVVEKQVVSNDATVGIYYYRRGADFVRGALEMIADDERVNNEFYVAPVYNRVIRRGAKLSTYDITSHMYGLGVPEDMEAFLASPAARAIRARD